MSSGFDHNQEENIEIKDEKGEIKRIQLQRIRWDRPNQSGESICLSVQYGSFGVAPKYEFALKRLKEDVRFEEDCSVKYWTQLNNDYIVKLFLHGKFKVGTPEKECMLITEFCNAGSLFDLIRKRFPGGLDAHYYGLLLRCICKSLGYLGAQNPPLLNRHIMPSKIMLHKQPNGKEIFKLNGFANFRECPTPWEEWKDWQTEDYVSGTYKFMKYCHPRVLKKYLNKDDKVTNSDKKYLDLYSSGALLYVAATGKDPIRPLLFEEICKKLLEAYNLKENDSEVLSMFQEPDNSSWILEYDFPKGLPLSSVPGLLPELRKLIVNLLQVNQKKIMPFNDFVDESERILNQYLTN